MLPIEIEHLTKIYSVKRGQKVVALDDLSLRIEPGEVVGFLGPNGSGKSTTIKTLLGQIRATRGTACIFGEPVSAAKCRRLVGYLPENPSFYDFLTSHQYLKLVGAAFGMDSGRIRIESDKVLELLDLRLADRRPIRSYSKGMVQRLGLAQALLHDPDLYILDEPMSGLDPLGRALVKEIIADLKSRGKTVFFSTHVTADVEAVCDRVAVIKKGKLQAMKQVADLLEQGIEGYYVQLAKGSEQLLSSYERRHEKVDVLEIFVPRARLNNFMEKVSRGKGEVLLMEPKRRNLEEFFLDIVKREQ